MEARRSRDGYASEWHHAAGSSYAGMYGPKFNSDTQDVVTAAGTATVNTIVP